MSTQTCCSPPSPIQCRCAHDADDRDAVLEQADQRGPHRYVADEVLGPVDGVDHPLSALEDCVAAEFLAEYGIRRTMLTERRAHCSLDSQIGVGDGGEVRLVVHSKVEGAEAGASDRVRLVGDTEG